MKIQWHNDSEAFMLFGKELNKIIAALQYLSDRNPDTQSLNKFIDRLINMRSYDEMLASMIMETRVKDISEKQKGNDGLSLNEILKDLDIRKWKDSDRKD